MVVANSADDALVWDLPLPAGATRAELVPIRGGAAGEHTAQVLDQTLRVSLPARDGIVVRLAG